MSPSTSCILISMLLAATGMVGVLARPMTTSHAIGKQFLPMPPLDFASAKDLTGPVYPVGGNIWPIAIYFMYINGGTPSLPYCVAIDTGSTTSAFPDASCTTCSKNPLNVNYYNSSASSTSKLVSEGGYGGSYETCNFADPGAICSDSGNLYADTVGIGSNGLPGYQIGSITSITSNFDQFQVCGGIMGLFGDTLFSESVSAGLYSENVFGMCLAGTEGVASNGTINFGGIASELYTGEIQWTPNTDGVQSYSVQVNNVTVLGTTITSIDSQAILDSGTNVILLNQQPFTDIETAFKNSCAQGSNLHGVCDAPSGQTLFDGACFAFTEAQIAAFPPLVFNLANNTVLPVAPQNYLNLYDPLGPNPNYLCLGLRVSSAGFLVGDVLMANQYVIFDNSDPNNLRIGWAAASSECGSVPIPTFDAVEEL